MKRVFAILILLLILSPAVSAATLQTGENILVTKQALDDSYILAGNGNIEADVLGDLYIGGGSVVINGNVFEDLFVFGGKVTVAGDVAGDVRVVGGQVAIYGNVGDDVLVAGGQVDLGKKATVGGSLFTGSGIVTIDGYVKEQLRGITGMLFLNGSVAGDVIVTVEDSMSISETAKIGGNLEYSALIEATVPEDVVVGEIKFNKFERESVIENLNYLNFLQKVLSFSSALLIILLMVIFMPKTLVKAGDLTHSSILRSFGVGLLTVIAGVIGPILLMITIIGIPISLIIFAVLMITFYFAKIFVAAWLSTYIFDYKTKKIWIKPRFFVALALALLFYYLIDLIPYVGWLLSLILFFIGIGSMVLLKIEYWKFLKEKKML